MRNISEKVVEKIKTHILCSTYLFVFENLAVYEIMWKSIRVRHATDYNMAHGLYMLDTQVYRHKLTYVEIKCQLDATEVFIADLIACSTCFGHHCSHHQELKSIMQWLLPVVFRAVVFQVAGLVWS